MALYLAMKVNKSIKSVKVHRFVLNRGQDGLCSAAIVFVCATKKSIRIVILVYVMLSQTFTEISKYLQLRIGN